jgi:hypothetical protein
MVNNNLPLAECTELGPAKSATDFIQVKQAYGFPRELDGLLELPHS